LAGFSVVAPASSAVPIRLSTVLGWDTTSDSENPRKPVVCASDARSRTRESKPKAEA
jgi:hypothetical protein